MNYQDMNIKNPTFGGFKPDAMSRIARTLGYEGEMSGFQQYLDQNPDKRTQMDQFKQAAMMMAKGGAVQKFNQGGNPVINPLNPNYKPFTREQIADNVANNPMAGMNPNQANAFMAQQRAIQPAQTQQQSAVRPAQKQLQQLSPFGPDTRGEGISPQSMPEINPITGLPNKTLSVTGGPATLPIDKPITPWSTGEASGYEYNGVKYTSLAEAEAAKRQQKSVSPQPTLPVIPPIEIPPGEFKPIYDPSQGMPEPLPEEFITGFTVGQPSWATTGLTAMFKSGKLPEDPTDFTSESIGNRKYKITYKDGTTMEVGPINEFDTEPDTIRTIVANKINEFKNSPEYTQKKAEQDAYRNYITEQTTGGVTGDIENIEEEYNNIQEIYRQQDLELKRLQQQAEANPDDPYIKQLVEAKGKEVSDSYMRLQQLQQLYQSTQKTIKEVMIERSTDPTLPEGATVTPTKIETAPDQFIAEGTGQVSGDISYTPKQGNVTLSAGVDQPATATYNADQVMDKAKIELDKANAATGNLSSNAVIQAVEGILSPEAIAEAQKFDNERLSLVPTDPYLAVNKNQLAEAKGSNLTAVKAQVAQSDMLEKAVAETTSVQPEELPPPAQIAEDQMAQAETMTMEGLTDDATAVAAKLEKFTVDDGTLALAMQGDVGALDTVEGQLSKLMKDFDDGTPAWAAGAIRAANAAMAARGLGASSMAGAAILQAAMESALPIAQQDAATFANMNLTNLNNRQQVALTNAAAQQGLQLQNLSNEQAAALANSANAFALQSQNLSNMQSVVISNAQIKAALQGQNLTNEQQSNLAIAARFAEVANLNLTNKQQTALQNNTSQLQTNLANLESKSQAYITNANLEASLQGQVLSNEQQVAITNAARFSAAANLTFTAEQQAKLHNSTLMQTIGLAELSAAQAATLQNAATIAGMDMANLNNRQQAAVENAKAFLQIDLTNLNNAQQMAMFKAQATQQALLSDQAAENAAKQFNAQSENQANQFFSNLEQQNNQFNAAQANAMEQFNVGQENAAAQFNAEMKNNREQFNAQNELVVAQSNATWRREIATADTAAINRANEINAINTLDISNQAYDNVWNLYGDQMEWAVNSYESEADRVNALTIETMRQEGSEKAAKYAADASASSAMGKAVVSILTAGSDSIISGIFE